MYLAIKSLLTACFPLLTLRVWRMSPPKNLVLKSLMIFQLGGRFDIFYLFFCSGRGRGSPRRGEDDFLLEIPGGGGGVSWVGGGGGGEGPGGCLHGIRGRGLNIFFRGRKAQEIVFQFWGGSGSRAFDTPVNKKRTGSQHSGETDIGV